ncbi:hypothetical protein F2Q70_00021395 [Brassica cretica]|uniref:Uncharacterized protein n=2 Tax=Brassica cretica TaxID=69181 RepID=A0A8S9HIS8_BRACR|nr:hypothetical protein F2Q70_00021395 [Brassica cretica]KAF2558345.1 hypothetical protein F2Q68_00014937 [Brassica cretica]KAF3606306.1 hypothetical protein DY000_02047683 [Brassica cretica]
MDHEQEKVANWNNLRSSRELELAEIGFTIGMKVHAGMEVHAVKGYPRES